MKSSLKRRYNMENFLRIWSIIVIAFFMIISTTLALDKNPNTTKGGFLMLIFMAPVFYYIIKF
jgi:hypothetical protein